VKIIFAASEMRPLAETGGLGDFVGSLTKALQGLGHEVAVFLPFYPSIAQKGIPTHKIIDWLEVPMGGVREQGKVFRADVGNTPVFLIEQPFYFNRAGLYGDSEGDYEDNDRRFTFFFAGLS